MTAVGYAPTTRTFVLECEADRAAVIGQVRALIVPVNPRWRVTIEPDFDKRTPKQNRRNWSVMRYVAANAWVDGKQFSAEAWHAHYCGEFIGWEEGFGGERVPLGTGTLNTKEHNDFIDRVMGNAAQLHGVDWSLWDERTT